MTLFPRRYRSYCLMVLMVSGLPKGTAAQDVKTETRYPVIPYPTGLRPQPGSFTLEATTTIYTASQFKAEGHYLQQLLQTASGLELKTHPLPSGGGGIFLKPDPRIGAEEGYRLLIQPGKIVLSARTPTGIFRGIETLRQLLPPDASLKAAQPRPLLIPAVTIDDSPAYGWRGMHLDVARHFFSIGYLKKFLDVMALYKMNKLHLHLTDDQGWRVEINAYPKLTQEGAWRSLNEQDSACMKMAIDNPDMAIDSEHLVYRDGKIAYGGFYTQQQLRELVAYAAERHIDIIPEIDMPGHMMAAMHAYPFLSCDGTVQWGALFSTPICPCQESTFAFAENVYKEIFSIFPYQYVHLGADEVDRKEWAKSPACSTLIAKQGLKNVDELQGYFVKRMEAFFNAHGKKLIGWDEILEGGISQTAYVMYWRSWVPEAPIKAARHGNFVIMSPGNPLYFDRIPDAQSIKEVYDFNPVPKGLSSKEARFIIGAQANIWTEHIASEHRADFMYMPRMTALSERLWSNRQDYTGFRARLQKQYSLLDAWQIHYRLPDLTGFSEENVFTDSSLLDVRPPLYGLQIRYTTDGSTPGETSPSLESPLTVVSPVTIKMAAFNSHHLRGDIYTLHYKKESYAAPVTAAATPRAGLTCRYYKKFFTTSTALSSQIPDSAFVAPDFVIPAGVNAPSFGLEYNGFIDVPRTGIYTFFLTCDDGGILYIAGREVVNNDGLHPPIQKTGQVALTRGMHPLSLDFIEGGGGFKLALQYSEGNDQPADIPPHWLSHQEDSLQ